MGVGGKGIEDVVDANTVKKHFKPEITPLDYMKSWKENKSYNNLRFQKDVLIGNFNPGYKMSLVSVYRIDYYNNKLVW